MPSGQRPYTGHEQRPPRQRSHAQLQSWIAHHETPEERTSISMYGPSVDIPP